MNRFARITLFSLGALLVLATPALAQGTNAPTPLISFSGALGAGLVAMGAAFGIGRLASAAYESMARQPEIAGTIQVAMIISAALIEGFTFFALVICMQQNPWKS